MAALQVGEPHSLSPSSETLPVSLPHSSKPQQKVSRKVQLHHPQLHQRSPEAEPPSLTYTNMREAVSQKPRGKTSMSNDWRQSPNSQSVGKTACASHWTTSPRGNRGHEEAQAPSASPEAQTLPAPIAGRINTCIYNYTKQRWEEHSVRIHSTSERTIWQHKNLVVL